MRNKKGFTLIEVIISILLLSLVLMALYKSSEILRKSNIHLFNYLQKSTKSLKGTKTLFIDLIHSDYNITIDTKEKFHRLTLASTRNSLYGEEKVKVIWLVYKKDNTLLRLEGTQYNIPLKNEQRVEVDVITHDIELFKIYKSKTKTKILVMIKVKGQEPQMFMCQNIPTTPKKSKAPKDGTPGKQGKQKRPKK